MQTPKVAKSLKTHAVLQGRRFNFTIADGFLPSDGSLHFKFKSARPDWLNLDEKTGVFSGIAPKVRRDIRYKLTIIASNILGSVVQSFTIKVLFTDVVASISTILMLIYSLRKQRYGFHHIFPYTPDLLEYLYAIYMNSDYYEQFISSLKKEARKAKLDVPKKVTYKDFYEIIHMLNPTIDHDLQERLPPDSLIFKEQVNNEGFRRMFLQGSQPLGAIPIPLWNPMGAPKLHNWSSIDIVFSGIERELKKRKARNDFIQRMRNIALDRPIPPQNVK